MKHTVRLLIAALFVTLGVTPALADAAPPRDVTTITINQPPPYTVGQGMNFLVELEHLRGNAHAVARVECYRGTELIFTRTLDPTWEFFTLNMDGPSDCIAWVEATGFKGGFDWYRRLTDHLGFHVDWPT